MQLTHLSSFFYLRLEIKDELSCLLNFQTTDQFRMSYSKEKTLFFSIQPPIYSSIHPSIHLSVHPTNHTYIHTYIYINLYIHQSINLPFQILSSSETELCLKSNSPCSHHQPLSLQVFHPSNTHNSHTKFFDYIGTFSLLPGFMFLFV